MLVIQSQRMELNMTLQRQKPSETGQQLRRRRKCDAFWVLPCYYRKFVKDSKIAAHANASQKAEERRNHTVRNLGLVDLIKMLRLNV